MDQLYLLLMQAKWNVMPNALLNTRCLTGHQHSQLLPPQSRNHFIGHHLLSARH
jgi:hypothetical protein